MPSLASFSSGRPVMSAPSASTWPPITLARPRIALSSVVLPAPLGPTTATSWPAWTLTSIPRSTGTSPYPADSARVASAAVSADDIGVLHLLASAQFGHPPLRDDLALRHHHDPFAQPLDGAQLVLDQQDGQATAGQFGAGRLEPLGQDGGQPGHRLVEQ